MLNRTQKEEAVAELRDKLGRASSVFLADYRGLTVEEVNTLRRSLRQASDDYEYRVAKNSLLLRASNDTPLAELAPHFEGPTALAISYAEPVGLAKVLVDYAKEHQAFELKGGFMDGKPLDQGEIATLATLPSLDQLRATLVGLIQAPATKIAAVVAAPGAQLARLVEGRRAKLAEAGDGS
jgi:large subunit ribosomal protein L10